MTRANTDSAERGATAPLTRIRTKRGDLTVNPATGALEGLWGVCERELMTVADVLERAGTSARSTLIRWRADDFPAPVLTYRVRGGDFELFSRTQVEAWLRARSKAKRERARRR